MISLLWTNFEREKDETLPYIFSSFMQQTVKEPFEIIIADNGSNDRSKEIINKLLSEYNLQGTFIDVPTQGRGYNTENGGSGKAINYGIQFCKGDKIVLGHTDFYLRPDALELLTTDLDENVITMPATYWLHDLNNSMDWVHSTMQERLKNNQHEGGWDHLLQTPGFFEWDLQGGHPETGIAPANRYMEMVAPTRVTTFHVAGMTRKVFDRISPFPVYDKDHGQIDGWFTSRASQIRIPFRRFEKPILIHIHHGRRGH